MEVTDKEGNTKQNKKVFGTHIVCYELRNMITSVCALKI